MDLILECCSIDFSYGKTQILHDISFDVEPGLFYAILGKNGSGKTTLLHCLNGILQPGSGLIKIDGQNMASMSRRQIAKQISLVPQEKMDLFPFRVIDVVVMGRAPFLGMTETPGEKDYKLAMDALKMLDSEKLAECNFNRISGGERQIALLAAALVQAGRIMLLDEPTNHLDFNNQYRLLLMVKELCRKENRAVIATMHDPNMAMLFADRVIMIKNGRIIVKGTAGEIMTAENIGRLYGTKTVDMANMKERHFFLPESVIHHHDGKV